MVVDLGSYGRASIVLMTPVTDDAIDWIDVNLPDDSPCLGNAVAIELRYARDIINGIRGDGLTVAA